MESQLAPVLPENTTFDEIYDQTPRGTWQFFRRYTDEKGATEEKCIDIQVSYTEREAIADLRFYKATAWTAPRFITYFARRIA